MSRKRKLQIRMTPEYLRSEALREARDIVQYGWRPSNANIVRLKRSTADARAYRTTLRAWRGAGFPLTAIRRIAGRI
jgi:hypothetical protein